MKLGKRIMKSWLLMVVLFFVDVSFAQIQVNSLYNSTELPTTEITRIKQDKKGFIWIASNEGLYRFDGYVYEQHAFLDEKNTLPLRRLKKLEIDAYGRIWLMTHDNNLYYYDLKSKKVTSVRFHDGIYANSMTLNGRYLFVGRGRTVEYVIIDRPFRDVLKSYPINSGSKSGTRLGHSRGSKVWFDSSRSVIVVETKNGVELQETITTPIAATSICVDANENIWISSGEGLFKYDVDEKKWIAIEQFQRAIRWITFDAHRNGIWLLTPSRMYFINTQDKEHRAELLSVDLHEFSDSNEEIFIDNNGDIWLDTYNDLLKLDFAKNNFKNSYQSKWVSKRTVSALYEDDNKNLWVGTLHAGLFVFSQENQKVQRFLEELKITSIHTLSHKSTSVSTARLLNMFDSKVNGSGVVLNKSIEERFLRPIVYAVNSSENIFWTSNNRGMHRVDISGELPRYETVIPWNDINCIYYNKETHSLLVGGFNKGILHVRLNEQHEIISIKPVNDSKNVSIKSLQMIINEDGVTWAATSEGISKLTYDTDAKEFFIEKNYTEEHGLSDNFTTSLVAQNDSVIWVGTRYGLNKFDVKKESFTNYYKEQGFHSNKFIERAAVKTSDGKLHFGVQNGMISFNPSDLFSSKNKYQIHTESIAVNGKDGYSQMDLKNLGYTKNNIEISIRIPNYVAPRAIKYRYKLSGSKEGWTLDFASNNTITLNDLSYGSQELVMQCANEDGKWSEEKVIIPIHIYPPFWMTWWFVALCAFLFVTAVYSYIRFSVRQITGKKEFLLQLELEKKIRETDKEKIRFFTNVSHDLKTPLTMVSEPLQKLLKSDLPEDERTFLLETASRNTNRLVKLMNQVLSFSTIQSGQMVLNIQKIKMVEFLNDILTTYQYQAKKKNIQLTIESDVNEIELFIDKEKVERVVFNLLSNSFKNTSDGGRVVLRVLARKDEFSAFLEIEDTGKGIKKEKLGDIFSRFFQSDARASGQGIGLSIVKEYIEAHEGRVTIESEPNIGTKVILELPKEEVVAKSPFQEVASAVGNEEFSQSVLLVEDDSELRNYITYELSKFYKIYTATNGKRAFEICLNKMPDVIITDLSMPEMTGLELTEKVKSDIRVSHIPIIMITAAGDSEVDVLEKGVNDYLKKPLQVETLLLKTRNQIATIEKTKDWFEISNHLTPQLEEVASPNMLFVQKLMHVIEENFIDKKLDIELLTSEMGMSKSALYKKTSQLTGQSVNDLITTVKLKIAVDWIVNTSYALSEITYKLGYNDVKYFRELFKKKYGTTPSSYRKAHKNKA